MAKIKCALWMTLLAAHSAGLFSAMAGAQEDVERARELPHGLLGGVIRRATELSGQPVVDVTFNCFFSGADRFTDKQFRKLAPVMSKLKHLEYLDIAGTSISNAGLKHVAKLKQLRTLYLPSGITDAGLKKLAGLEHLEYLFMGHMKMTGVGLRDLAGLKNLRWLDLHNMSFTDAGMKELGDLKQLKRLGLRGMKFSEAGLKELAGLTNLTRLNLSETNVTDEGLKHLKTLRKLDVLRLHKTRVTVKAINDLQNALFHCRIEITSWSLRSPDE